MEYYLIWLSKIFEAKYSIWLDLMEEFTPEELYNMNSDQLSSLSLAPEIIDKFLSKEIKLDAEKDSTFCKDNNIKIVSFFSEGYPINLKNIQSPPPILYYKGTLLPEDECSISIVGSRRYTPYGQSVTKKIAYELASAKVTIVSGMARGIDSFSHEYAIKANGRTLAVLGCGVDIIYPEENSTLYNRILENGAIISEFPLHTPPIPKNFPVRNRIVAGLSFGTLVIEANLKSGTMITARLAAEAGRDVYAVPGSIFDAQSQGTNLLIRDGAKIVTSSQDILKDIYWNLSQIVPKPKQLEMNLPSNNLEGTEKSIYDSLSLTPILPDVLADQLNAPVSEIVSALFNLELEGSINKLPSGEYVKNII